MPRRAKERNSLVDSLYFMTRRAYVSAMAVADISPIHGICHQDVDERAVQRSSNLK